MLYNFFFNCSLHQEVIAQRALDRYENIIRVLTVACNPRGVGMGPYPHPLGELACWLRKVKFVVEVKVSKIC